MGKAWRDKSSLVESGAQTGYAVNERLHPEWADLVTHEFKHSEWRSRGTAALDQKQDPLYQPFCSAVLRG